MATLKELRAVRLDKLNKLRKIGVNPFPAKTERNSSTQVIADDFEKLEGEVVIVAGRIMAYREHGKLAFADIQDQTGRIQLYIKQEKLTDEALSSNNDKFPFESLGLLDIGDFIEGTGTITKTQRGEISVEVSSLRLLTKSLRPLPEKRDGLTDIESRYRRRYLDLTMNSDVRDILRKRGIFTENMRQFLINEGFDEVETPILESITGGAEARPFITHHNALDMDMYLRISLELPLKRLITGGMEKVFEIGRVFRNEGMSMMHLQHYTQMELYWAYADFEMLIDLIERMNAYIVEETFGTTKITWQGTEVDFKPPWPRIDYQVEFQKATGIDLSGKYTLKDLVNAANKVGVGSIDPNADKGRLIDQIYKKAIREKIIQPTMLVNHPLIISPLSKQDDNDPRIVKRFQPVMLGAELGNGWNELNDPLDQYDRFGQQQELLEKGDDEAMMMDIDYVEALEYGMPPTVGFGVGIDRLFMYAADLPSIRDTIYFPIMRPHVSESTKDIYNIKEAQEELVANVDTKILDNIDESDLISISKEVATKFNGIKTGFIVFEVDKVERTVKGLEQFKQIISRRIANRYNSKSEIKASEKIRGVRDIYKLFGIDPNKKLNSSEALIRRIVDGKGVYKINSVVDIYNITSAELELPMAAYDLGKVEQEMELRFASEADSIVKIGDDESTEIHIGELVYGDQLGVICLDYNYRDANRTKITEDTKKFIVVIDGHDGITTEDIEHAQALLVYRYEKYINAKPVGIGIAN